MKWLGGVDQNGPSYARGQISAQMVVSAAWVLGIEPRSFARVAHVLLTAQSFLQPGDPVFNMKNVILN